MTQHFDLGNTPLNKATPEVREKMVASMKRIFSGERLTYTDKEMELVMMRWQAEMDKQLQEQNTWLDKKLSDYEKAIQLALDALGPEPPECCGCQEEWRIAINALNGVLK